MKTAEQIEDLAMLFEHESRRRSNSKAYRKHCRLVCALLLWQLGCPDKNLDEMQAVASAWRPKNMRAKKRLVAEDAFAI